MTLTTHARRAVSAALLLSATSLSAFAASPLIVGRAPVAGLADLGASDSSRTVRIAVMLHYRDEAGLQRLVAEQQRPGSPLFHRYLSSAAFAAAYAPDDAAQARVVDALQRGGFRVTQGWSNRTVIDAEAPAPVAARFFATSIHEVQQPGVGRQYANVAPAVVPEEIAPDVLGVAGLSNIRAFSTHIRRGTPQPVAAAPQAGPPMFGTDGGYGPRIFVTAYKMPSASGYTGTGHGIGIVIDADYLDSDIGSYLSYFQVTRTGTISRRLVDGGPAAGLTADSNETTLDVETTASLATGSNITVYEGVDFNNPAGLIDAYNAVVADNTVDVVNASLGYCETAFGTFPQMVESVATQGAALGITFNASTGDSGDKTYGCNSKSVNVPAAAPHVVAVGGTALAVNKTTGRPTGEKAWTSKYPSLLGATGGGVSTVFALPSWQVGVANVIASGRNSPDHAFDADPSTGESWFYNGSFQGPIGGTSLASPIFSSGLAMLNQQHGARAGWFNPTLYAAFATAGYGADFRDITQGAGGTTIGGGLTVKTGYDQVTGIGATLFEPAAGILAP